MVFSTPLFLLPLLWLFRGIAALVLATRRGVRALVPARAARAPLAGPQPGTATFARAFVFARKAADAEWSIEVTAEILAMAVLSERHGVAAHALRRLEVNLDEAIATLDVVHRHGRRAGGRTFRSPAPRLSREARAATDRAMRHCLQRRGDAIDTGDLLAGLVDDDEGIVAGCLGLLDASPARVRAAVANARAVQTEA